MTRLLALLRWETTIQFRLGIFYAAAFIAAVWILMLYWIPDAGIEPVLVSVLFIDLGVFGFLFMPGLYYLEKGERVLEGLVVTPLRSWEYLSVKIVVLSVAASAVGAVVTLFVYGTALNWLWFLIGMLAMSYPLSLLGFVIAARFNGINEYLLPGAFFLAVMQIPLLTYFGIVPGPFLYILPSGPGHDLSHRRVCQYSSLATHIRAALRRRSLHRRHHLDSANVAQCRCPAGWRLSPVARIRLTATARKMIGG